MTGCYPSEPHTTARYPHSTAMGLQLGQHMHTLLHTQTEDVSLQTSIMNKGNQPTFPRELVISLIWAELLTRNRGEMNLGCIYPYFCNYTSKNPIA